MIRIAALAVFATLVLSVHWLLATAMMRLVGIPLAHVRVFVGPPLLTVPWFGAELSIGRVPLPVASAWPMEVTSTWDDEPSGNAPRRPVTALRAMACVALASVALTTLSATVLSIDVVAREYVAGFWQLLAGVFWPSTTGRATVEAAMTFMQTAPTAEVLAVAFVRLNAWFLLGHVARELRFVVETRGPGAEGRPASGAVQVALFVATCLFWGSWVRAVFLALA